MSYQKGDVLFVETDGFVDDVLVIIKQIYDNTYEVFSTENSTTDVYSETVLMDMTITGEDYRSKYGITK